MNRVFAVFQDGQEDAMSYFSRESAAEQLTAHLKAQGKNAWFVLIVVKDTFTASEYPAGDDV